MKCISLFFPEVKLIEPRLFSDERGFFSETYQKKRYAEVGIDAHFVQDNFSRSKKHTLRGLHYQLPYAQGKLVYVTRGQVLDLVVDIRRHSPTFGKTCSFILDDINCRQAYIPPGFAHGFYTLSDEVDFCYKCTEYYHPETEKGIIWNDPTLAIEWPSPHPFLSEKDARFPMLAQIAENDLPD
ncbi:MAG: dTDP-4-dehydrorhamnose 3,5-epimerase [Gammaproteobacteria bacterium]|nr:dTDP-4-dehydrorhamnose 3,5-epimerase [Gammaproteobacteria bacterium]